MAMEALKKIKITLVKRAGSIAKLGRGFKIADKNDNGSLDFKEFANLLQKAGTQLSKSEFQALFKYFDIDSNGTIS